MNDSNRIPNEAYLVCPEYALKRIIKFNGLLQQFMGTIGSLQGNVLVAEFESAKRLAKMRDYGDVIIKCRVNDPESFIVVDKYHKINPLSHNGENVAFDSPKTGLLLISSCENVFTPLEYSLDCGKNWRPFNMDDSNSGDDMYDETDVMDDFINESIKRNIKRMLK